MGTDNFTSSGVKLLFFVTFEFYGGRRSDFLNFRQGFPMGVNLRQQLRGDNGGNFVRG